MEIHQTPLPGVGVRHDFETEAGRQVGVVTFNGGRRQLVVYDRDDPDASHEVVTLAPEEAETMAELLGAARITGALDDLQQRIEGLAIDWLGLRDGPFVGRPLGDTQCRTRTGVSIVAVLRGEKPFPSPGPDFMFESNDVLVVVGTPEGIKALTALLAGSG